MKMKARERRATKWVADAITHGLFSSSSSSYAPITAVVAVVAAITAVAVAQTTAAGAN